MQHIPRSNSPNSMMATKIFTACNINPINHSNPPFKFSNQHHQRHSQQPSSVQNHFTQHPSSSNMNFNGHVRYVPSHVNQLNYSTSSSSSNTNSDHSSRVAMNQTVFNENLLYQAKQIASKGLRYNSNSNSPGCSSMVTLFSVFSIVFSL